MFQPAAPIVTTPNGIAVASHTSISYMLTNYFTVVLVIIDRLPPRPEDGFDLTIDLDLDPPAPTSPPSSNEVDAPRTRTFFPETWLFLVNQTKYVECPSSD